MIFLMFIPHKNFIFRETGERKKIESQSTGLSSFFGGSVTVVHTVTKPSYFRTSLSEVFCNIGVFNFFQNSQGKHLCQSIFNNGLRHRFFPQNFANISKTIFCARVSLIMDFGTDFFLRILQIFQKQFFVPEYL